MNAEKKNVGKWQKSWGNVKPSSVGFLCLSTCKHIHNYKFHNALIFWFSVIIMSCIDLKAKLKKTHKKNYSNLLHFGSKIIFQICLYFTLYLIKLSSWNYELGVPKHNETVLMVLDLAIFSLNILDMKLCLIVGLTC